MSTRRQKYNQNQKKRRTPRGTFSLLDWISSKKNKSNTRKVKQTKQCIKEHATIIRFHSKHCGHCIELDKIWPSLVKQKSNLFKFIDVDDVGFQNGRLEKLNKKFNVNMVVIGYPTIYKIIHCCAIPFNKNRDAKTFLKWMTI